MSYAIHVEMDLGGTAVRGSDYDIYYKNTADSYVIWNGSSVTIPANQTFIEMKFKAKDDTIIERLEESITVTITDARNMSSHGEDHTSTCVHYVYDDTEHEILVIDNDKLEIEKVTFSMNLALKPDPGSPDSTGEWRHGPYWWKGKQLHWDTDLGYAPVAYSSDDNIAANGVWRIESDDPTASVDLSIQDELYAYFVLTVGEKTYESLPEQLEENQDGSWSLDFITELEKTFAEILGKQAMYDPTFQLQWKFYVGQNEDGTPEETPCGSGTSTSCLYVTYDDPVDRTGLYHTVVHTGCLAAMRDDPAPPENPEDTENAGVTDDAEQDVFEAIWDKFAGLSIKKVEIQNGAVIETETLRYYGKAPLYEFVGIGTIMEALRIVQGTSPNGAMYYETPEEPTLARELAKRSAGDSVETLLQYGDARCGIWGNFAISVFNAQGILVEREVILLKNNGSEAMDFRVMENVPGQGGVPMESIWNDHVVINYGGIIYDPSYGKNYGEKSNALSQFVQSIDSIGYHIFPGVRGYGFIYVPFDRDPEANDFMFV